MIHFTQGDAQMLNHTVDVIGDRMHHEDGYTDQDRATVTKLDKLAKAGAAVVITGAELADEPHDADPQVRQMFQDIVKAELAHWVPGASQRLIYRAGLVLGVHQPMPRRDDCGPERINHALVSYWVAGLYLHRCSTCFRLFEA